MQHGRSPAYQRLAEFVATSGALLTFLAAMPTEKQQPNLLFAAARHLLGQPADPGTLRRLVEDRGGELADLMRRRRTQTNGAARCACLLPALASLPGPLALLEVGASAGLTLLPDLYSYDYDGHRFRGRDSQAPVITCHVFGPAPLPKRTPAITWRAGTDLNPLDVTDEADLEWLRCLAWPGEEHRLALLDSAAATARHVRPRVHGGDLLDDLARVAAGAPKGATLVVYHTAVLAYVDAARRAAFARAVAELGAVWLSNEAARVIAEPEGADDGVSPNGFRLIRDGRQRLAITDPHGTWLHWTSGSAFVEWSMSAGVGKVAGSLDIAREAAFFGMPGAVALVVATLLLMTLPEKQRSSRRDRRMPGGIT